MKKLNLAVLAFLALLMLASCSKENKGIVIDKAEKLADDAPTASDGYEYLEGVGSWLDEETEYKPASDENIECFTSSFFGLSRGNLYFQLKKEESKKYETGYSYTLGHPTYAYISNLTGEKHFICPDPLCTHGAYSGCQYLDLGELLYSTSDASILFTTKTVFSEQNGITYTYIYEINNSAATLTPIYTPVEKQTDLIWLVLTSCLRKTKSYTLFITLSMNM